MPKDRGWVLRFSEGQSRVSCDDTGPAVPVLREAMKSRLIQMEEALFIASGQRFEAESEAAAEAAYLSNSGRKEASGLCPHHTPPFSAHDLAQLPALGLDINLQSEPSAMLISA